MCSSWLRKLFQERSRTEGENVDWGSHTGEQLGSTW